MNNSRTNVIAKDSYIHEDAIKQMENTAKIFENIFLAVGMPDLHPGNQFPIGVSFLSHGDVIYPALVGNDIGCGMSLYQLPVESQSFHPEKVKKRLISMEGVWKGESGSDDNAWQRYCESIPHFAEVDKRFTENDEINKQIGTIGGGNHFAELLMIEEWYGADIVSSFNTEKALLLVHSGSRLLGQKVLEAFKEENNAKDGVHVSSAQGIAYLKHHDYACDWANANRKLIARRFLTSIGIALEESTQILDVWHNRVSRKEGLQIEQDNVWLHRKGAAPSDEGLVVIPGSRGAYSYLVLPISPETHLESGYSLAHGAGRKLQRGKAVSKIREKYQAKCSSTSALNELLLATPFQSAVVCDDADLLVEEHQDAYKEIDDIVHDLVHFGLVQVVAKLKPIITYKMKRR
ncbi:release factor H-coupled RctB family protein [Basidiobolus meristosporus CBS 931.73]|uniref:3'-phosphate/5'-hydroxy nucleic acid ligase n=1 Tax=Basidiobolus meristosporus CBS 931.73 TaxID=1314790 RepID=A0A1Y1YN04_9FUNG|nr:release factor H-coupled RctB family protein [Basidiobolus meristosporus CBS 931.73]|eukprot:ORX99355.1 release factor H-coupled RctB family protein [Basidiobolus meristosporus CBS 931.73]